MKSVMELLRSGVRPTVTLLLVVTMCAGFWAGKLSPEQFGSAATLAIGFWFGSREGKR